MFSPCRVIETGLQSAEINLYQVVEKVHLWPFSSPVEKSAIFSTLQNQ